MRDGNAEAFGERQQRVVALRDVDAAADQQQRALGLGDQLRGAFEFVRIGARAARLRLQGCLVDPEISGVEIVLAVADVLRHVEHHGTGASGGRDRKRPAHQFGNALGRLDADQLLAGGLEDFDLPRLLRHVLPGVIAVRVADDRDHRHAGIERFHERGDQIGRAGAECRVAYAGAVGHARVGVGSERAAALVVDQEMTQPERAHRLVEGKKLEAAHAEQRTHAGHLEHLGERLTAIELAGRIRDRCVHFFSFTRAATRRATSSFAEMPISPPHCAARLFTAVT